MNRKTRISLKGQIILSERYDSHLHIIRDTYPKEREHLVKEYLDMWRKLLDCTRILQDKGRKGNTRYLVISLLHSSFVTKTYDFRFDVYDKELYMDSAEVCNYWCPAPFFKYIADDIAYFSTCIKKELVQVTNAELEEFEMEYAYRYAEIAFSYFCETCREIFDLKEYSDMKKEDTVSILLGSYIGKAKLIAENKEAAV